MTLKNLLLIIITTITFPAYSQPTYTINYKTYASIIGLGLATTTTAHLISQNVQDLTPEEIYSLDRNDINTFDRQATYNYSLSAKNASDYLLYSSFLLPVVPLIDQKMKSNRGKIYLLYGETLLVTHGITQLFKNITLRPRPYVYNEAVEIDKKQDKNAQYSFFSGHTSIVASMSFLTATIYCQHHPESRYKFLVWSGAVALPLATSYFRVKAGKHFPTDVITGSAVGAIIGTVIPRLYVMDKLNKNGISMYVGTQSFVMYVKL